MMKKYEKPLMEVILIHADVLTDSCEGAYPCDTQTPAGCVMGYGSDWASE